MTKHYDIPVIYEDDDIVAVDKPAGLLSVPGRGPEKADSAQSRIAAICPGAIAIHRLDMCTSGLMLIAKHKDAERHYKRQFEERRVEKTYYAIVHDCPEPQVGSIALPLIADWPNRPRQKVCYETGKPALTHYEVIASGDGRSRVRLTPHTGRSHQLRVHLMAIGHPIIGDNLYGHESDKYEARLHLHAAALSIHTPQNQLLDLNAPLPF
ncbi:bifunctional tRNA pseudouridine(32) synthase/ribosomal large subunit pseudouridine synthase RluA [Cardiobacteriaceae bacterium TAE3-ERU3]|nr:bifunctional tRNA pseudouridine(32) synthase/ribosomal large subunit pseudouridine synthase RluA [Cardiobacteriaceae bacterium TAE3-ERU3]